MKEYDILTNKIIRPGRVIVRNLNTDFIMYIVILTKYKTHLKTQTAQSVIYLNYHTKYTSKLCMIDFAVVDPNKNDTGKKETNQEKKRLKIDTTSSSRVQ